MSIALIAFALQVLPPPAGPAWEAFDRDEAASYAFDPASVRREGGFVRVHARITGHRTAENGLRMGIVRYRIDCARRTITIEAADGYGEDGALTSSRETGPDDSPTFPVARASAYRLIHARLCGAVSAAR